MTAINDMLSMLDTLSRELDGSVKSPAWEIVGQLRNRLESFQQTEAKFDVAVVDNLLRKINNAFQFCSGSCRGVDKIIEELRIHLDCLEKESKA